MELICGCFDRKARLERHEPWTCIEEKPGGAHMKWHLHTARWQVFPTYRFQYLTPRIRITPRDLVNTMLDTPRTLHFICSPMRASVILSEIQQLDVWNPLTIYEPIPVFWKNHSSMKSILILLFQDRCIPEELPPLTTVLPFIDILRYAVRD